MKHVSKGVLAAALAVAAGCPSSKSKPAPVKTPEIVTAPPAAPKYDKIDRPDFNRRAAEHALPLFWRNDVDHDGAVDPDELVQLWGWDGPAIDTLVSGGGFTKAFDELYAKLSKDTDLAGIPAADQARRTAILLELSQGSPTLVETDLGKMTDEERAVVDHVARAAVLIEKIHAKQNGVLGLSDKIAADDPASRMVFFRNQSPMCQAPKTESDPNCIAIAGLAKPASGLYPAELQAKPKWCESLAKMKNGAALTGHFSVVVDGDKPGTYKAVPYTEFYKEDMEAIAKELEGAAMAIMDDTEAPFVAYLQAAAAAFRNNDWEKADVAWAAMGAKGSKWYLRIAPDEVYYEPCAIKAGFHVSFARINPDSVTWRERLEPVKNEMEAAVAAMIGKPYKARKVGFRLPDFIDVVLNAGDSRSATGATIGQSLPNWGKVKDSGGRTMATTNLYTDPDSAAVLVSLTSSVFCPATQQLVSTSPAAALMTTVLHEAAHNLGPAGEYKVGGKTDDQIFGGPLASMLEELKAQTLGVYFSNWLFQKGVISEEEANAAHVRDVAWAFGHIAQGMYTADGAPKAYSQLASVMMASLRNAKVLTWNPDAVAANGTDKGCFDVDLAAWPAAIDTLAARVAKVKGKGDKKDALAIKASFIDAQDDWAELRAVIAERWLRAPKASFVYAFKK